MASQSSNQSVWLGATDNDIQAILWGFELLPRMPRSGCRSVDDRAGPRPPGSWLRPMPVTQSWPEAGTARTLPEPIPGIYRSGFSKRPRHRRLNVGRVHTDSPTSEVCETAEESVKTIIRSEAAGSEAALASRLCEERPYLHFGSCILDKQKIARFMSLHGQKATA